MLIKFLFICCRYSCYNDQGMPSMGWQNQPQQGGQCPSHQQNGPTQQQLSVVTTVWGVKTSNQSGPPMSHNYGNGPPTNGAPSVQGVPYGGQSGHDGYTGCPSTPMPPQKSYQTQAMSQRGQPGQGYAGLVHLLSNIYVKLFDKIIMKLEKELSFAYV